MLLNNEIFKGRFLREKDIQIVEEDERHGFFFEKMVTDIVFRAGGELIDSPAIFLVHSFFMAKLTLFHN